MGRPVNQFIEFKKGKLLTDEIRVRIMASAITRPEKILHNSFLKEIFDE